MTCSCRKQRALPFFGPAFTAQLDMTYRGKIQSCSTILCTAEVESIEGRKVGMLRLSYTFRLPWLYGAPSRHGQHARV